MILDRMKLDGKVAIVTGGSQGLGLGIAKGLAEAGADVAIVARSAETLTSAADALREIGHGVAPLAIDVAEDGAPQRIVDETIARLGRIDILVTSAASQLRKPALDVTPDEWDRMIDVNLKAVYFLNQAVARAMIEHNAPSDTGVVGKIINIASLTSVGAWPNVSIYGTTKGGVAQLTKAMALELAPHGVLVNAIGPGTFHTELTDSLYNDTQQSARIVNRIPLGRPGKPEDLAGSAVFLASGASDYLTGQVIYVDGGFLLIGGGL